MKMCIHLFHGLRPSSNGRRFLGQRVLLEIPHSHSLIHLSVSQNNGHACWIGSCHRHHHCGIRWAEVLVTHRWLGSMPII